MVLPQGDLDFTNSSSLAVGAQASDHTIEGRSFGRIAWNTLKQDRVAMAGGCGVIFVILVAIFAGPITHMFGYSYRATFPDSVDQVNGTYMPLGRFGGISVTHLLGVTPGGSNFDIFSQLVYGARTSIIISVLATLLSLVFGVTLGLVAGYFRGFGDTVISRIMDLLLSFPVLLFSIALLSVFAYVSNFAGLSGEPLRYAVIIFVLGFFGFPYIGRIVRGQVLSLREKEFVDAARSLGASNTRILAKEILPNLVGPILVYTTLTIPNYILGEAGLSYLGVGVLPPTVSWGGMLSRAGNFLRVDPTYLFIPGIAIFLTVLAFNLFGDGLRDALDPKSMR